MAPGCGGKGKDSPPPDDEDPVEADGGSSGSGGTDPSSTGGKPDGTGATGLDTGGDGAGATEGGENSGGSGGTGGDEPDSGGTHMGGALPEDEPTSKDPTPTGPPETVDLLFVVDNSVSMADKQELFASALPAMVNTLISPACVDSSGNRAPAFEGSCQAGWSREFEPVDDIHIGVVTSSLGGFGSNQCQADADDKNNDDRAYLIPKVRGLDPSDDPDGTGFLTWTGGEDADREALIESFRTHVIAADDVGCGFEAPLEAWYRFLVDPQPPEEIVLENNRSQLVGVDQLLLAQRRDFLRPTGVVAIVVLSDENDCSIIAGGDYYKNASYGYLTAATRINGTPFDMPIATLECEDNPNDTCCFSCLQASNPPTGCQDSAQTCDPVSSQPAELDNANLRCFEQKRRFGLDLLYPTERYISALTETRIRDTRNGRWVDNPLMIRPGSNVVRNPNRVLFAGVVGVPWQDIATKDSLEDDSTMDLLDHDDLLRDEVATPSGMVNRWDVILGQPRLSSHSELCRSGDPECEALAVPPLDPFMVESVEPRPAGAANPITGDAITGVNSTDPLANGINGHEANHLQEENGVVRDDMQYACIYPLAAPTSCDADDPSCDCAYEPSRNRPLCQPKEGGAASNTQHFAKAYPGTRILEVLRGVEENGVVGSICPKIRSGDPTNPNYGYNPVMRSIVQRIGEHLPSND